MWTRLVSQPHVLAWLEAWVSYLYNTPREPGYLHRQRALLEKSSAAVMSVLQSEPRTGTLKVRGELEFKDKVAGRRLFCSSECPDCVIFGKVT